MLMIMNFRATVSALRLKLLTEPLYNYILKVQFLSSALCLVLFICAVRMNEARLT